MDTIQLILNGMMREALSPQTAAVAIAVIGLNIHFGFTGLLNMGQSGFMLLERSSITYMSSGMSSAGCFSSAQTLSPPSPPMAVTIMPPPPIFGSILTSVPPMPVSNPALESVSSMSMRISSGSQPNSSATICLIVV